MGVLLDFKYLCYLTFSDHINLDFSLEEFKLLIKDFHFSPKSQEQLRDLYFEFEKHVKFGVVAAREFRKKDNVNPVDLSVNIIKQFVLNHKSEYVSFVRFLSFIVCFPVSEAVVESWGPSLENAVKDGIDSENVGTVYIFTFIR